MGQKRNAYMILVGKPEGKRPLGRPRRRWVDNIKMNLREIGWDGVDWMDIAQDRHLDGSCEHGIEPPGSQNAGKFLRACTIGGSSRRTQLLM
jgi:hypothetical protein